MLEKFLNIFRIPDLRKRVLFTLGILAVYRLGAWIPTPGINTSQLELLFNQQSGSALGLMDLFSGGTLRRMTIFALGIMPYITASIIFQLLTVVYEPLARIQKEGELGRRKITVNAVAPGAIETDFFGGAVRDTPEYNQFFADMTALGRVGVADDIGPMIASLLSDDNRWVNAQRIEVSGGQGI